LLLHVAAVFSLTACHRAGGDRQEKEGANPSTGKVSIFDVRGVVKAVKPSVPSVVVSHDAIEGYMEAMTMEFQADDPKEVEGLTPGDAVRFRLTVTDRRGWIDQVQRLGRAEPQPTEVAEGSRSDQFAALKAGDKVPECILVDQEGHEITFEALSGSAVALTFIFTRCPYPEFCPRMMEHFHAVQAELSAAGQPSNWKLISVTIDPAYDTTERLAAYAQIKGADSNRWVFATGQPEQIEKLSAAFGLTVAREGQQLNHNLRTVVIDRAGRVQRIFVGNGWTPADLIAEMRRAAE
jgi:protein SCO1/2